MNHATTVQFGETELAALNARADARCLNDANAWDEAVDWGVPDYRELPPLESRMMASPEFD